jgi:hypothetical protein
MPGAHPATSLGYTTYFYAQDDATSHIKGYNISFAAEYSKIFNTITVSDSSGPATPLGGTHMTCSNVQNPSGGSELYVFAQENGDDITVYTRDQLGGAWSGNPLPIPDT